jgi:NADH dehydrogenase
VGPRVVIIGAGFAGLEAARALNGRPVQVTVLDRRNFHTFTPLLYQVATAGLEPDSITKPLRAILRSSPNVRFRIATVTGLDLERCLVLTSAGDFPYDYLLIAAGSAVNYLAKPELAGETLALKDLDDAVGLRSHVLYCFEQAVAEEDGERRRSLTSVVVVGGGPTGVELAGALAELRDHVLRRDFPELDVTAGARVVLVEAGPSLLPGFPKELQVSALRQLRDLGVDVRLESPVEDVADGEVRLRDGSSLHAGTVVWVAGVTGADFGTGAGLERGRQGRFRVLPTLQLEGHPEVFAAGDIALAQDGAGNDLPMMAPVAIQEGRHAAMNILAAAESRPLKPFRYRDRGVMATIGRQRAVAYVRPFKFSGLLAWFVWLSVHLLWLIGYRNKLLVLIDWAWNYLFYEQGARIITTGRVPPPSRGGK